VSTATVRKERLEFKSGGTACVGYLYGKSTEIPKPCIIMRAGFGGTQDTPSMVAVETAFAQAGFHAFTFDYRNLGESEGEIRQLVSVSDQQEDFMQAIRYIKKHNPI
jgi:alpha/beta superfamily hydrolase